uniref:Transcription factor 24 n=1 Tax=Callorhinchus milii TaxID=7868 RepID=A0A4W3GEQ4_CALMI
MDPAVGSETVEVDSPGSPSPNSDQDQDRDQDGGLCPVRQRSEPPGRPKSVRPRGRPAAANAARERSRVQTLRNAFLELQRTLPSVPPDTKLSKLDVLILATTYIAHLTRTLEEMDGYLHPVKVSPSYLFYYFIVIINIIVNIIINIIINYYFCCCYTLGSP